METHSYWYVYVYIYTYIYIFIHILCIVPFRTSGTTDCLWVSTATQMHREFELHIKIRVRQHLIINTFQLKRTQVIGMILRLSGILYNCCNSTSYSAITLSVARLETSTHSAVPPIRTPVYICCVVQVSKMRMHTHTCFWFGPNHSRSPAARGRLNWAKTRRCARIVDDAHAPQKYSQTHRRNYGIADWRGNYEKCVLRK